MSERKNYFVTGNAGFIGFHVTDRLLRAGHAVTGLDNLNDYYDVDLKRARLDRLRSLPGFDFHPSDLCDRDVMNHLFEAAPFDAVIHLAAQAGVRYSLTHPEAYVESNLTGFLNILECCRKQRTPHLLYASSSSVYGLNRKRPYSERDPVDHPVSLYAATKRSNELMAHAYSHLFEMPTTGLRFFTVYGPWGRPDMAIFKFTKAILNGTPIDVYNNGDMKRDFTYIDDIVEGILGAVADIPVDDPENTGAWPDSAKAPFRIYNIGNNRPIELASLIEVIEEATGKKAIKRMLPMQPGDVLETHADIDNLHRAVGFSPKTDIRTGVKNFVQWYKEFYGVS